MISIIPYAIRTWQGKIHPNMTSWSLWTIIGLAILLTYKSSGAQDNIWPAVFGLANPLLITAIIIKRKGIRKKLNRVEKFCLVFCLLSLAMWLVLKESRDMAQYALYLAMLADLCAAFPTFNLVWKNPESDRPFPWAFFSVGYGLVIFAVEEATFANYFLPAYMFFGASSVAAILAAYRIKNKIPLKQWF